MVPIKRLYTQDSPTFLARVGCSLSGLWHCGLILLSQFRALLGLLIKLHTVLQLSRSLHLKLTEKAPLSNGQVVEVKKDDKELLNWFGRADNITDADNLQCGSIQPTKEINSQLTLNKCNLNDHQKISMSPFISENSPQPSSEENYSQPFLNKKFKQDRFRDDYCTTDGKCVAVRYALNQCTVTKMSMREWNNTVADEEGCSSIDDEEWDDSEEEPDTQCDSYESLSDEEQNEILWKSFFIADLYNPLNFAAHLNSSSTKLVSEDLKEQCLEENEKGENSMTEVNLSFAQKPILSRRNFQHFCKLGTGENIKLHVWRKSAKCTQSEQRDKVLRKPSSKKLRFSPIVEVHTMVAWSFALREARKGHWMQMAHDRARFLHRIQNTELAIGYCLQNTHRMKIWKKNSQSSQNYVVFAPQSVSVERT